MKKVFVLSFALLAIAGPAFAARPSTLNMTCAQASALVQKAGAIVLSTGRFTYDRYVSSGRYCGLTESAVGTRVPTRDSARCLIGGTCVNNNTISH